MIQEFGPIEIDIDGRTQKVRPVGSWVLQSNNVVAEGLAVSLKQEKPPQPRGASSTNRLFGDLDFA